MKKLSKIDLESIKLDIASINLAGSVDKYCDKNDVKTVEHVTSKLKQLIKELKNRSDL